MENNDNKPMGEKPMTAEEIQKAATIKFGACPIVEWDLPLHSRRQLIEFAAQQTQSLREENERLRAEIPRWIPVEERLPEDESRVLFYVGSELFPRSGSFFEKDQWDRRNMFCDGAFHKIESVSFWTYTPIKHLTNKQ